MHSDIERIREALQFIDASDRETWLRMGMAIKSELADTGFDLWEAWSLQAESFNTKDARDVWKSIRAGGKVTLGTLFYEAKANGWRDDGMHQKPTPEEIAERRRDAAERAAKEETEIARERADTAKKAAAIYKAGTDPVANPYLSRKRVSPVATLREIDAGAAAAILGYVPKSGGDALTGRLLVVPVKQGDGLSTLELIDGDKRKAALAGRGSKVGGYWATERLPDGDGNGLTLLVGEGVATVLSAKEATGHPAIAALSSGNLPAVAKAMRERYPAAALVILADLVKATGAPDPHAIEAAQSVGGKLAIPDFGTDRPHDATDFNDMAQLCGGEAVARAIANARELVRGVPRPGEENAAAAIPAPVSPSRIAATQADLVDSHRNAPRPDEAMLYGLVGDVGRAAAATTEANRFAVAAGFMSFLSAAVGRDTYIAVGNTKHHARLFTLHVGRTGRGRKGDAISLVQRIRLVIEERHREQAGNLADPFCGGHHFGGLSTREGLALLIHDGFKNGKDETPAILDKRLWVVESEFANVLHQAKRDGNTLSAALRDAWDGISIRPATKTARLWASDPHIALSAAITPSELLGLTESRELSNGFANRFLIFWAERERIEPFPKPTHAAVVEELVQRTMAVIGFAICSYPETANSTAMELSADAQAEYARLYRGELSAIADGEKVTALLERRAPMLLRMAMLFALTDLVTVIEVHHIHAALAWTRFHRDSVRFIFNDAAGEDAARESTEAAKKIVDYLRQHGRTGRRDLQQKCFSGHLSATRLDEALDSLLMDSPPRVELIEGSRTDNGKLPKFYQLLTLCELGEPANLPTNKGFPQVRPVAKLDNLNSCQVNPGSPGYPGSQVGESAEALINRASSPSYPSSHKANGKQIIELEL